MKSRAGSEPWAAGELYVMSVAFALSFNDGYYSDVFNWISGSATWTINSSNTLEFAGAGNLGQNSIATYATPLVQNNSSIFNIIYTYNSGPLTVTPYVQWSHVSKIDHSASIRTPGPTVLLYWPHIPSTHTSVLGAALNISARPEAWPMDHQIFCMALGARRLVYRNPDVYVEPLLPSRRCFRCKHHRQHQRLCAQA